MTYANLGTVGKAIAHNMVERDKKSLMKECKENDLPYNKIRELIHDDKKILSLTINEINKIREVFGINYKLFEPLIIYYCNLGKE